MIGALIVRDLRRAGTGAAWLPIAFFLLVATLLPFAIGPDARLLAVCDTLEALSHPRPYREGLSPRDALGRIRVLGRYTLDGDIIDTLADELEVLLEDEILSSRSA